MRHECAVPGCGKSIVAGMLMCRLHWFKVSAKTRAWVNHTWEALQIAAGNPRNPAYLERLNHYRSARAHAVLEVQGFQEREGATR